MFRARARLKKYGSMFIIVLYAGASIFSLPVAALTNNDFNSLYNNTPFYDPTDTIGSCNIDPAVASVATDTTNGNAQPVIVLDPGHAPGTDIQIDPGTGLAVFDYENKPEMQQVWDIAQTMQKKLEKDGYKVVLTKSSLRDSSTNLKQRAETANDAKADLVVSIHTTPGSRSNGNDIFVPKVGEYLEASSGGKKFKYSNQALADTDAKYAQIMKQAREAAENDTVKAGGYGDIYGPIVRSQGSYTERGTMLVSQYFAKVPWLYNEIYQDTKGGGISASLMDAYTTGMLNGIEKIVPVAADSTGAKSGGGTIQMQTVDLSGFHPDPQAVNYFNKTALPAMKKYIPLYVKAAQEEGVSQNWEILAALHGPETGYSDSFKSNGFLPTGQYSASYTKGPSGPYQETASEMVPFLSSPTYGPALKTLITPDGDAIPTQHLNDTQFDVLSRLVYKHWVSSSLGNDYDKLKQGPAPFDASTDSSSFMARIMARWNGSDPVEGFNGFDTGAHSYNPSASVWPGLATTYYLLKQWEANGGMDTINVASSSACGSGSSIDGLNLDCQNATDAASKLLCAAEQWDPKTYVFGGGHESAKLFMDHFAAGQYDGLDCSSLVGVAVYNAFGVDDVRVSSGYAVNDSNWKSVPVNEAGPGDVIWSADHIEFVIKNKGGGNFYDFGAHTANAPVADQIGFDTINIADFPGGASGALHYVGPGSTP